MPKKVDEAPVVQETLQNVAPTEAAPVAAAPVVESPAVEEAPVEKKPEPEKPKAPKGKKGDTPVVEAQAATPKKVKVMLVQPVDCIINGQRYDYPAQKMVEVPEDVAQILVYGKKAYRM